MQQQGHSIQLKGKTYEWTKSLYFLFSLFLK